MVPIDYKKRKAVLENLSSQVRTKRVKTSEEMAQLRNSQDIASFHENVSIVPACYHTAEHGLINIL